MRCIPRKYRIARSWLWILFCCVVVFFTLSTHFIWQLSEPSTLGGRGVLVRPTSAAQPGPLPKECLPRPAELVGFPNCLDKLRWISEGWKTHQCYAAAGINGTGCSFREYLSTVEDHCPLPKGRHHEKPGNAAIPNFKMDELFARFRDTEQNFVFIRGRITRMWDSWVAAYKENAKDHPDVVSGNRRLKILLHLGFLSRLSGVKIADKSTKGGPLGELVQWSDLLASLHILGHDLIISTEASTLFSLVDVRPDWQPCPSAEQYDLVFTDIMGLRALRKRRSFLTQNKCKFRILDSFGTHAEFNSNEYYAAHAKEFKGKKNPWGNHGFVLRQFLTLYPHTPDNTFLGFVVNSHVNRTRPAPGEKRAGILVYGKEKYMWEKAAPIIQTALSMAEVHATVADAVSAADIAQPLPEGVINHGLLDEVAFHALLSKVRVFLGLGFPFEGPAPLEAIAHGAVFINPRFDPPKGRLTDPFFAEKPTLRALSSQSPYLEELGPPWVLTVDSHNEEQLRAALQEALASELKPRLPEELTARGMLLRVAAIVSRMETCNEKARWPTIDAMRVVVGSVSSSCEATCAHAGLRCEPVFFPYINTVDHLRKHLNCERGDIVDDATVVAPARCKLQTSPILYSCASSEAGVARLCPCREFLPEQRQLCPTCLGPFR